MTMPSKVKNLSSIVRETFTFPIALNVAYVVASVDPGTLVVGTAMTLATPALAGKPLRHARLPTLTITDNAFGSALTVKVRIVGRRFGKRVTQDITVTSTNTAATTVAGTKVVDCIISVTPLTITNAAASDNCSVGLDGKLLGLRRRLRSVKDVKKLFKVSTATPDSGGCVVMTTLQASAVVDVANSAINVYAAYGSTAIAVTDTYEVEYVPGGAEQYEPSGYLA